MGRVTALQQPVNIADLRSEDTYQSKAPLRRATADLGQARSFAAIPMMSGDRLIGAFTVYRTRVHPFNDRSLELAQLFADQAAIAIENARGRNARGRNARGRNTRGHMERSQSTAIHKPGKSLPRLLAVLPFRAADEGDDGLTRTGRRLAASITMELSANPLFRLIDQASSFSDRLTSAPPTEVAEILGAGLVVSGTVREIPAGGYRVAVALHQADRQAPLWTERFDFRGQSANSLLEQLLPRLCAAIGTRVERQMITAAQSMHPRNQGAMDHFLRGLEFHHRHGVDDFPEARRYFKLALDEDPEFGRAAAALAITFVRQWFWESLRADLLETAQDHARTAIGLAPHDAWSQTVWGVVALYKGRHGDAALSFQRAMELAPFDAYVVSRSGLGKLYGGEFEAAIDLFQQSIELDPLHADRQRGMLGHALFHEGRLEEAIESLDRIEQPLSWELAWRAACSALSGDSLGVKDAVAQFQASLKGSDQRYLVETRPFRHEDDRQRLWDGLRAAGLGDYLTSA